LNINSNDHQKRKKTKTHKNVLNQQNTAQKRVLHFYAHIKLTIESMEMQTQFKNWQRDNSWL